MTMFTHPETWVGGHYELQLEYADNSLILAALRVLWRHSSLFGVYLDSNLEPEVQRRHAVGAVPEPMAHMYGVLAMPDGNRLPCGTCTILDGRRGWLNLYLPVGGLGRVYPLGAFPFDGPRGHEGWRRPLNNVLAMLARTVYADARFRFGTVGFEIAVRHIGRDLSDLPRPLYDDFLLPDGTRLRHERFEEEYPGMSRS